MPVFVLTHDVPDDPPPGAIRFVTSVRGCAAAAGEVAGEAVTSVVGAGATRALLNAGELDELELHVVPVILGQGRRLFDHLCVDPIALERFDASAHPRSNTSATGSAASLEPGTFGLSPRPRRLRRGFLNSYHSSP